MRIPKSMAPIESRFAATPPACKKMNEKNSDSGIVSATITAARTLTRKAIRTMKNQRHPQQHVMFDRVDGQLNKITAVVIGENFYVGWQDCSFKLRVFCFDPLSAHSVSVRRAAS